jgi:hypothetical protein
MAKVSMNLDPKIWQAFRMACLEQSISASKMVTNLLRKYLEQWHTDKEQQSHEELR